MLGHFIKKSTPSSHPNVLPIIDISTQFPFSIMTPWMPDGNITQYIQMNPDVNRLMLVRTIDSNVSASNLLIMPTIACTSVPGPDASSWVRYFSRQYHSGKQTKGVVTRDAHKCLICPEQHPDYSGWPSVSRRLWDHRKSLVLRPQDGSFPIRGPGTRSVSTSERRRFRSG